METKMKKGKSSFLSSGSSMRLGKSKFLQGVVTLAGIVLYLLARKSKNKMRHTFLLVLVYTLSLVSFSCTNKKQDKMNRALDNAIEKVEDEADKLDNAWEDTNQETRKEAETLKIDIEKIQK